MRAVALSLLLLLAGCASTAPHTIAAAAVNSGLATGVAAVERSAGGCYAVCAYGTVCNPKTGFCEKAGTIPDPGMAACLPGETCSSRPGAPGVSKAGASPALGAPPVGVSPATGTAPPFPPATSVTPPPATPRPAKPE